jgi:hypothetical protein
MYKIMIIATVFLGVVLIEAQEGLPTTLPTDKPVVVAPSVKPRRKGVRKTTYIQKLKVFDSELRAIIG